MDGTVRVLLFKSIEGLKLRISCLAYYQKVLYAFERDTKHHQIFAHQMHDQAANPLKAHLIIAASYVEALRRVLFVTSQANAQAVCT